MKFSNFLAIGLFIAALFTTACTNQSEEDVRNQAVESVNVPTPAAPAPGAPAAAANASGVMHYTCPKNCAGSGGAAAGTCPVCGSEYVHNQAFHDTPAGNTPPTITPTTPTTPATPEPAQNPAGVWHYTCSAGCAGGAGAAGTCSKCGGALAHNAAYHN